MGKDIFILKMRGGICYIHKFPKKLRYVKCRIAKIWMKKIPAPFLVKGFENDFELRWNMCVFIHLIL
ncbi:hypothetical protein C7R17_05585 [Staphylococcus aureus]|nr:hypothetical protein C7R17_05585 [Staphylococcus aureus]